MIYINDKEKVESIQIKKDNFYVVADFDKTLTEGNSNSTWAVMANANEIGEEYTKKRTDLYNHYRPIEIDSTISDEEKAKAMTEWWKAHINLFFEYELKEESLKKSLKKSGLAYRAGAKKFLREMSELNIPVIIISAGIGNIIEEFLKNEEDYYNNIKIISNFIKFEDSIINGLEGETIHALNKNIVSLEKSSKELLKDKEYILLFGDGLGDLKMTSNEDRKKAITIGFLDEKIDENLEYFNSAFDIVITNNGTFDDVNNILNIY